MSARERSEEIVRRLREAGHEAYLAGGCVRDLLLGREPGDYDIATSARPDEIQDLLEHTVPVGAAFGVVLAVVGEHRFEVATFRKDGPYEDGRHPSSIRFSDAVEDARRRDFTINGLFLDPATGEVLDVVGGREDLERGIIRAIGDPWARFREDRLRLLRAVRFACALDFEVEEETWRAVREESSAIAEVSRERVRDELRKILVGGGAARGLRMLKESGLLEVFLPEVAAMVGVEQPPEYHPEGDVWTHCLAVLEGLDGIESPGAELAFGALLHDVGKPPTFTRADRIRFNDHARVGAEMTEEICRRLRMSRAETFRISDLVRLHMTFLEVRNMRPARLRRFLLMEHFTDHLELHRLDCEASHGSLENYEFCLEKLEELRREPDPLPRLITGRDLIDQGFSPGPHFAKILTFVEEAQVEHRISTREEALRLVRERFALDGDPLGGDAGEPGHGERG